MCSLTNESRDLLVGLDLLVESLDILCQAVELLGGLLQSGQVCGSSVCSSEGVELDRRLDVSIHMHRHFRVSPFDHSSPDCSCCPSFPNLIHDLP